MVKWVFSILQNTWKYSVYADNRKLDIKFKLNKKVNWVKSCFATCDKDELFLGKNVLNARITQEQFVEEMKKIK